MVVSKELMTWLNGNNYVIKALGWGVNVFPPGSDGAHGTRIMTFRGKHLGFKSKQIKKPHPEFMKFMTGYDEDTVDLRLDPTKVEFKTIINIITTLTDDFNKGKLYCHR